MRYRFLLLLALGAVAVAVAQESIPAREAPSSYKSSASLSSHQVAAEFLGNTVPAPSGSFLVRNYVVVEIAVFPAKGQTFVFDTGKFSLRLNGKKSLVLAQTAGMVAAALKYPSWGSQRSMTATAGVGDAGVILGRDTTARFPGDRRAPQPPVGMPPKNPGPQSGIEKEPETPAWDWVAKLAWLDGEVRSPSAGLLYFPYEGNLSKIKQLELVIAAEAGEQTLTLR